MCNKLSMIMSSSCQFPTRSNRVHLEKNTTGNPCFSATALWGGFQLGSFPNDPPLPTTWIIMDPGKMDSHGWTAALKKQRFFSSVSSTTFPTFAWLLHWHSYKISGLSGSNPRNCSHQSPLSRIRRKPGVRIQAEWDWNWSTCCDTTQRLGWSDRGWIGYDWIPYWQKPAKGN